MRVQLAVIVFSILLFSSSIGLQQAHANATVKLIDLGVLQLAAHDLFDVDRGDRISLENTQDFENGKLDLSTLLLDMRGDQSPFPDSQIRTGGEAPRNAENVMIFTVASSLGNQFVDAKNACINGGGSEEECFQTAKSLVLSEYYTLLDDAFMRAFGESRPTIPIDGCATKTENLALRTIHDFLPDNIELDDGTLKPIFQFMFMVDTLTLTELDRDSEEVLDGFFADTFTQDIFIPGLGPEAIDLKARDDSFAVQFSTDFTFDELLLELRDGSYNPSDKAMIEVRNLFAKGLGSGCYIGGEIFPIDSTALLLAGAQSSIMWFLPIVLAGAGLLAYRFRKF